MPLDMTDTFEYFDNDPNWERNIVPPSMAKETPMPEATRQAEIIAMVTAATLDEAYATLWISQGIDTLEARKRLRDLMPGAS